MSLGFHKAYGFWYGIDRRVLVLLSIEQSQLLKIFIFPCHTSPHEDNMFACVINCVAVSLSIEGVVSVRVVHDCLHFTALAPTLHSTQVGQLHLTSRDERRAYNSFRLQPL